MKARRTTPMLHAETSVVRRDTGQEVHRAEENKRLAPEKDPMGIVKVSEGITLSLRFHSVRIDIGIELPCRLRSGEYFEKDVRRAYDKAYAVVQGELETQATGVEELLRDLASRHSDK